MQTRLNAVPDVAEDQECITDAITETNFFKVLDEPLRFVFKVPFMQHFYTHWLDKEKKLLVDSLQQKEYYIFLGELLFYNKLGIETFEKLCITNYPEIMHSPDFRENLIVLNHFLIKMKSHLEENIYQLEREKKTNEEYDDEDDDEDEDEEGGTVRENKPAPFPLSTRTYFKYIDLNVRPLFKFEVFQILFGRWLRFEEIDINECFDAHYHNMFMEELLYYYDQGEGFLRSILKNTYVGRDNEKFTESELNTIFTLVRTFDAILDEAVKKIKEVQGNEGGLDKKQFLNHGYDFGMILYYVATKDAFNALMTARGLVIDTASKIWDKKQKKQDKLKGKFLLQKKK